MEIFNCDQGTPEWFEARLGIPTASMFSTVMAKGKGAVPSKTRETYMLKLAGEVITGEPMDSYSNFHMERGKEMEPDARNMYAFKHDADPQLVGFVRNDTAGASPDALLGDDGLLEIKTTLPHLLIPILKANQFPPMHKAQCQGQLWVSEREWVDLVVYWPRMPMFVVRAHRDEEYIKAMSDAVDAFNAELELTVAQVKGYADPDVSSPIMMAG